jgi:hypothetical protein
VVRCSLLDALSAVISRDARGGDSAIAVDGRLDAGGGDDKKAVVLGMNAISRWEEGVEAFDQVGMAAEQFRDPLDDAGGVNASRWEVSRANG